MSTPPTPRSDEIERLLALDLDDLYALAARQDPMNEGVAFSPGEAVGRGRAMIEAISGQARAKVCDEWEYCRRRHEPGMNDTFTLVTVVADLVVGLAGMVPAATVAVILVKKGLGRLCACGR